jgi:hypothetical protein
MAVTGVFVLPPIATGVVGVLLTLESRMFGAERVAMMPAPPWSIFISLMGILGVVWALARLIVMDDRLCQIDAIARVFVALLIAWGLFAIELPWVFAAFIATELLGTAATAIVWKRSHAR